MTTRKSKTINVGKLRQDANDMLASCPNPCENEGTIRLLEKILHDTGNYHGFRYLDQNEVTGGKPGIKYGPNGENLCYELSFENTDNTRRHYF